MLTGPEGPVEDLRSFVYWPEAVFGMFLEFLLAGASGSLFSGEPCTIIYN